MEWVLIGLAVFVLLLLGWAIIKLNFYKRLFSPAHFLEFAELLVPARQAAWELVGQPPQNPATEDPRCFLTSSNLAVFYTVAVEDDIYINHISLSLAGRATPKAVGSTFTAYVAHLFHMQPEAVEVGVSDAMVHHIVFAVPAGKADEFAARELEIPKLEQIPHIQTQCYQARERLKYDENFSVPL